ncbi:MAG TPA: hypothetical protein VF981_07705 [Gemmatimonadaceae bacterium]
MNADQRRHGIGWRLFATIWLVSSVFASTNVVRETYLAITLGSRLSLRVDQYNKLHPDLFEFPGRGWYINSNPGASILAAIPYGVLVRPAIALATRIAPGIAESKPPATYDDPRPNRTRFMNAARARGLDVVLGLAALGTAVTLMAPLSGLSAVLLFGYLRPRLGSDWQALSMALVYGLATPTLFRAAFLNQNAIVAHLTLAAFVLMTGLAPRAPGEGPSRRALAGMGALLGLALVCDYSAIPLLVVFGLWILSDGWRRGGAVAGIRDAATFTAGALPMLGVLLVYQWAAFGNPIWPAQRYMPPTEFSVRGWFGFTVPTAELLLGNLFDLRYGLFAFCPLLLFALAAPFLRMAPGLQPMRTLAWIGASLVGLLVFSSANQFGNLQWNTGVRYMMPVLPLLFIAAVPVLLAVPRGVRWTAIAVSAAVTLAVTMTREDIVAGFRLVLSEGPTLPILIVLRKMASGYGQLQLPAGTFWIVATLVALAAWLLWRPHLSAVRGRQSAPAKT